MGKAILILLAVIALVGCSTRPPSTLPLDAQEESLTTAGLPQPSDIVEFKADPPPTRTYFKDWSVDRPQIEVILSTWHQVSQDDWHNRYSHVANEDRMGIVMLKDGSLIKWMVRPGGLATLTLADGKIVYLAKELNPWGKETGGSGISEGEARRLATQYRDAWIQQEKPEASEWLRLGVIQSVEAAPDGWHVTFITTTGHDQPEGIHDYFLHVYIDRDGKLEKIVRGPDILS